LDNFKSRQSKIASMRALAFLAIILLTASLAFAQSVFHPASEVAAGTFGSSVGGGNFTFNDSLAIADKLDVNGTISGNGTGLTDLNASRLAVGIVPSASVSGSYTGITGVGTLTAGALGSGFTTVTVARGGTGISGAGGNANRVLRTSDGSTWAAAQVALATDVSGNLPVGNMPAGGSWALSSDLNIDSGKLYINDSSGNVGIGTTTPQNKLDVEGGAVIGATYSGTNAASSNGLLVEGNVGIGTTNPGSFKLNVQGGGLTAIYGGSTNSYGIWGGSSGVSVAGVIGEALSSSSWGVYGYDGYGGVAVRGVANSAGTAGYFYSVTGYGLIVGKGNVGIGTTSPGEKLEVVGNIISKGTFWTARTAAEANQWYSVTYGNGLFVAVSLNGTYRVMTSPDGITWTNRTAADANEWLSVTYGNGLFVATANTGTNRVMTSPDGITWTNRTAADAQQWFSVTYGNGLFVAVNPGGTYRVMTSPDGITWTNRTAADANGWTSVTYGNGLFVAVSSGGTYRVMTSPDGITWANRTAAEANVWRSVTYGNGLFVAVANTGTNRVMTSPDGITWTNRTAADANGWFSVTYGNGLFVAVANSGQVMTSPDGITWTARTATEANQWWSVTYGNGVFVAISLNGANRVMTSGKSELNVIPTNNIYQGGMTISNVMRLTPTDSPGTCSATYKGSIYYDASLSELCDCDGTSWAQVDGGGAC